ncbi:MAG: DNA primase [Deltaproteobacteria bacterium]|nr:MAG: DNA primase [Deltaproteobacteria bacterium]
MHYTRQELFVLRNDIPVDNLIGKLGIPSKVSEGYFRFSCPVCRGFDTGVNPKTNLARCFACEKNYNTIDLVMLVKRSDFIHSVKYLKTICESQNAPDSPSPSIKETGTAQPVSIGDVLKSMKPVINGRTEEAPPQTSKIKLTVEILNDRVRQLEHQITHLTQKIKAIEQNR